MTEMSAVQNADGGWEFAQAVVAAGIPVKPPRAWFDDPQLDGPTALTVTADGRVYGHACAWNVRHIGLPGNRTAPRSRTNYRHYLTGEVETDDGSMVATGRITMGAGHASLDGDIVAATEHYDNVCSAIADVTCGEDAHGLWFAGALRPTATPTDVRVLRASSVSGDWRGIGQGLELCGILAVNIPGFSTPRANIAASGREVTSLVAAGVIARSVNPEEEPVVAAPTPPPAPPADDVAPAPSGAPQPGDMVSIGDTGLSGEVIEADEDGVHVEVVCSPDDLLPATPEDALAASAWGRKLSATVAAQGAELRGMRAERLLADLPMGEGS
jgi:hypothetical protein